MSSFLLRKIDMVNMRIWYIYNAAMLNLLYLHIIIKKKINPPPPLLQKKNNNNWINTFSFLYEIDVF